MSELIAPSERKGPPTLRIAAVVLAVVVLLALVALVAFRNVAALTAIRSVARGLGYDVAVGSLDLDLRRLVGSDLRVTDRAGEPVLEAREVRVAYSLRDLLPGGRRLFGLEAIDVAGPHVTVIHHPDGTYNITLPPSSSAPPAANPPPLDVRVHVSDASVDLIDRYVRAPATRTVRLTRGFAEGTVSSAGGSNYRAGADLEDGGRRYPIRGGARFDEPRGFGLAHWTAAAIPIANLANFALSTRAIAVQGGELRNVDLTLGSLAVTGGGMRSHLQATAELADGRVAATALRSPIRDAHGRFVVDDDGATVRSLDAALNGIPLHLTGALYRFAAPQIAFAMTARGDLARLRAVSADTAKLPLDGAVAVQGLAEGPASNPVVFARIVAPRIGYGAYRFDGARGFVALSGTELDVLGAGVRYGGISLGGRASVRLQPHTRTAGYARIEVPADGLPYAAAIVPGMPLAGIAVVDGIDSKLGASGYLGGVHGSDRLDVPFAIARSGSGTVGPAVLQRHDGATVYARAAIDGEARRTVALFDVQHLSLLPARTAALPGLALPALPPHLDGTLDAAGSAILTGTTLALASGSLHGYGSWGDVRADADGSGAQFAARGRLRTSFERLAPLVGDLGGRGEIEVPFALANAGRTTIVQVTGARLAAGSFRGIAVGAADATLGLAPPRVTVYAARVPVDGSNVTAAGSFGDGGRIRLTAGNLDLRAARAAKLPLEGGRATLLGLVGGTVARPTGTLLGALSGARLHGVDVGGDLGARYDGEVLHLDGATVRYGAAYGQANGSVAGLAPGHLAPRYALHARLEDADIGTLARTIATPLRYPEGTLEADLRVGGAGSAPSVDGQLRIPEGSINGLSFRDGRVTVHGTPQAVRAHDGALTVGTTHLAFSGSASRTRESVRLHADPLDLADFNDYFDESDVLAGGGALALAFDADPSALHADADVALRGTRYRRFELGTIESRVRSAGTDVRLTGKVDGSNGRIAVGGSVAVPQTDPLRDPVRRSYLDVRAQIAGVDLGNVLPAAGVNVPLLGIVDGAVAVHGRYPALDLTARAALTRGVAGRIPIQRFSLDVAAANGHGTLRDLALGLPGLAAQATGTFGLRPTDPFDVRATVDSPDINEIATAASGKSPGVHGTLRAVAHATGTAAQPRLTAAVDAHDVRYASVTIPSVHTEVAATRHDVELKNGDVRLPRGGAIGFDGHAPLGGGADIPIAFDLAPRRVDVNPYSSLLPDGSVIDGIFDGKVGVRGTLAAPQLSGNLGFTDGSFHSNTLKSALTGITLQLAFAGTHVDVTKLHAHAAPGDIDGSGRLGVRDLRNPIRGLTTALDVRLANAKISAPKYYTGAIDGTLTARKRVAAPLTVGGELTFADARIPYTALMPSGGSGADSAPPPVNVAFDVGVNVARNVRIQSGPVDIGTTGQARLGGTLANPTLDGRFVATDGTVSLYRTFTVQNDSAVTFSPSDGTTPSVDATATTYVDNPSTNVLLRITGLASRLHLAFSSDPPYSQEQILGLLVNAQALGAVSGVASTTGTQQGPSITGIGEGLVNTQLTQRLFEPLGSKVGSALGLSNLNVNYSLNGSVSANARQRIGKNISFVYGEQIGGTTQQTTLGFNVGTSISGGQLTYYQSSGSQTAFGQSLTPFLQSGYLSSSPPNYTLQALAPPSGTGWVLSYLRKFW